MKGRLQTFNSERFVNRRRLILTLALASGVARAAPAQAQSWPAKPVRIVVPYGAGGNIDLVARLLAASLARRLGTAFIVDNVAGANGNIGTAALMRAEPDGHTIGMLTSATLTINPHVYREAALDIPDGLSLISEVASGPMAFIAHASLPVASLQDLIALARARPGELNCASGSNASLAHLTLELLKQSAGLDIVHVPYRRGAAALAAVVAGQVPLAVNTLSTSIPYASQGQIRILAVTSAARSPRVPDVPTVSEVAIAGFSADSWLALCGPPGLPADVVDRLQRETSASVHAPEIAAKLAELGSDAVGGTSLALRRRIDEDYRKWGKVVAASGLRAQ